MNPEPVLKLTVVSAAASLIALSGLAVTGAVGATAATPSGTAPGASGISRLVAAKLAANEKYRYTQLTLSIPEVAGKGVSAESAAISKGLRIVLLGARSGPGTKSNSELALYYKAAQLGQLRDVGGNLYVLLNTAKWSVLPVRWSKSATAGLAKIDVAFGERWLEVPAASLAALQKRFQRVSPATTELDSPAALEQLAVVGATGLLARIPLTESPASGHNLAFTGSGSLVTLQANVIAAFHAIGKQLGQKPIKATTKADAGTFTLRMSTGRAGAYLASITLGIDATGKGTAVLHMSFTHLPEPLGAPAGAKIIPLSAIPGL